MVKLINNKTQREFVIHPVERDGKKFTAREEAEKILGDYPGVFSLIESVKSDKTKEIIAGVDAKSEASKDK